MENSKFTTSSHSASSSSYPALTRPSIINIIKKNLNLVTWHVISINSDLLSGVDKFQQKEIQLFGNVWH